MWDVNGYWHDSYSFARDVAYQFGNYVQHAGRLHITTGGLSVLEEAFGILGWDDPHHVPELECDEEDCYERATCGVKTKTGYKVVCSKHYREEMGEKNDD